MRDPASRRPARTLPLVAAALGVPEDKVPARLDELHQRAGSLRALEAWLAEPPRRTPAGRTWLSLQLRQHRAAQDAAKS